MSPRRSSRSKVLQPTLSATQHTSSSSSSVSSGRADRGSRSNIKAASPRSSTIPRSQSSEDRETATRPLMRKTRSSHDDGHGKNSLTNKFNQRSNVEDDEEEEEDENDEEEEEEVTRCVCGHSEYPGMPSSIKELSKHGSKASEEVADAVSSVTVQEDSGGLFIQCDICKVWQHGGCVGIMDEAMSPEEYFCEQCRKDLHKLTMTANGQKHSIYLPVQGNRISQLSSAPTAHETSSKRARDGRASRMHIETIAGKRRSTMNSRDAAYDEAEQLRQAIEESKKYGDVANGGTGNPKGKRRRDESEPRRKDTVKRRRTDSGSSAASKPRVGPGNDTEDENGDRRFNSVDSKTIKGVPARNPRNKEIREREEKRERERSDAANRRKGRAERRRGDESDPSEESLSNTTSSKEADQGTPHLPSQIQKETPSTLQEQAPPPKTTHKKTGRPPARRGRQGRNQYTRDREPRAEGPKNPLNAISPGRSSNSREDDRSPRVNAHNNNNHIWGSELGKPSKPRQMNPNRTTMNDMKRRVAGILEFISHTQVEMAAEVPLSTMSKKRSATVNPASGPMTPPDESAGVKTNGATTDLQDDAAKQGNGDVGGGAVEDDLSQFAKLGSVEMMEILTKKLIKWQEAYGEK